MAQVGEKNYRSKCRDQNKNDDIQILFYFILFRTVRKMSRIEFKPRSVYQKSLDWNRFTVFINEFQDDVLF